jgi:hypothetical protein
MLQPDMYGIPENAFGPLNPELPGAIGRVVMLSALIEARIEHLLAGLTTDLPPTFTGKDVSANILVCEKLLVGYDQNDSERRFSSATAILLREAATALRSRNGIVHRVWARAGVGEWWGWKPRPASQRKKAPNEIHDYLGITPEDFQALITKLVEVLDGINKAVALAASFPRRVSGELRQAGE